MSFTITITEPVLQRPHRPLELPAQPIEQHPSPQPLQGRVTGQAPVLQLRPTQEAAIQQRLDAIRERAFRLSLDELHEEMRASSFFSSEALETWFVEFDLFQPSQRQERAFALAILIFSMIHPAITPDREAQHGTLLDWKERLLGLIADLIPDEDVRETILTFAEVGIREERVLQALCRQENAVETARREATQEALNGLNRRLAEAIQTIRERIAALQQEREEAHQHMNEEGEAVTQGILRALHGIHQGAAMAEQMQTLAERQHSELEQLIRRYNTLRKRL